MKPLISVIIPAYNEEKYIEKTLKCFKDQKTSVPFELIVCDNNSTDNTVKLAKKYAKVVHEYKQGACFARNTGAKRAKGEYFVFTDADTIFPENFIDEVYKIFKSNKYAGFSCGKWDYYEGDSLKIKALTKLWSTIFYVYMTIQRWTNRMNLVGWCLCTPKNIFNKVKGFIKNPNYLEDLNYGYSIEYLGRYGYFPSIKVRSSMRRFEKGVIQFIKHYEEIHAPISLFLKDLFRKRLTKPYNQLNLI